MLKKLLLAAATFGLAIGAYRVFTRGDRAPSGTTATPPAGSLEYFVSRPDQPAGGSVRTEGMEISPGEGTRALVYDEVTGRLKYVFEAEAWEPDPNTGDYRLTRPRIQILTAKGQVTHISSDTAEVAVSRNTRNRVDPKRGQLDGDIRVVIDRSTAQWRQANPELADTFAHPDMLITITLADAQFDMDKSELVSQGDILIDSDEARIEKVRGLTLQWNQLDNRLDRLRFAHGGRMTLNRGGRVIDFAVPGASREGRAESTAATAAGPTHAGLKKDARAGGVVARAMQPMSIRGVTARDAAAEIRIEAGVATANRPMKLDRAPGAAAAGGTGSGELRTPDALAEAMETMKSEVRAGVLGDPEEPEKIVYGVPRDRERIDTYRAVFENEVVVEQRAGLRTIGRLESDRLEVNFDFGRKQRRSAESSRAPRPSPPSEAGPSPIAAKPDASPPAPVVRTNAPAGVERGPVELDDEDNTRLVLTWNGPLEMRPIHVEPEQRTGERFDAIAVGNPVRVESRQGENVGRAECLQLVYRHERKQVWLSGDEARPIVLNMNASGTLQGRELFFDQTRGLVRVDGSGWMKDERAATADGGADDGGFLPGMAIARGSSDGGSAGDAVEIRWSRGVDLELGRRTIDRMNPTTGLMEQRDREYLRRAWFHGDVSIRENRQSAAAEELAVTFGIPRSRDAVADLIEHIDAAGDVRLESEGDLIRAETLEVEMIQTAEGRTVPRVADATGRVHARQGRLEFNADRMHTVLAASQAERGRVHIESLDASGNVLVSDPTRNLKISRAETLKAWMRDGNVLVRATVVSPDPNTLARVRYNRFAVHGHEVEIDAEHESVDVPGPGKAWIVSDREFGGRKLSDPTIVKTVWATDMTMRLAENYGVFKGDVHSSSDNFDLGCDKLTVRFEQLSQAEVLAEKTSRDDKTIWERFEAIVGIEGRPSGTDPTATPMVRRRPVHILADGRAVALSSRYAPAASKNEPGRLVSRVRIAGDQIVADLTREQMTVPCAGSLLIEDYTVADARARPGGETAGRGALMSSVRDGPSQTAITWQNSMDYFVERHLAAFDRDVSMVHRAGRDMVLRDELAAAMKVDDARLRVSAGRVASLSCGNLLLEFLSDETNKPETLDLESMLKATDLRRLIAKQSVHLQEDSKSLMGDHLQFLRDTNEVILEGGHAMEARIFDQEPNGRYLVWRGPRLVWNRDTNRIEAPQATVRTTRR